MCRSSKRLFAVFVLLLPFFAAASAEYDERFPRICEYHLKKRNLDAHQLLAEQVYGRPFIFREFFAVRPEAITKLGMDSIEAHRIDNLLMTLDCHENEFHPVVIRVQLFQSDSLQHLYSYRFPDVTPTFWREIFLYNSEMRSGYHNVIKKHRIPNPISFDNICSGFHADPDVDGIRAYVSFYSYTGEIGVINAEVGLDMPCSRVNEFSSEEMMPLSEVITPATKYCRLPVALFSRPELYVP